MSNLLINESPLMVLPTLAVKIGLKEAIILQYVHYCLDPMINRYIYDERRWIRNSTDQWREIFPFFSKKTIERSISILQDMGLLVSSNLNRNKLDRTKWYTIDYPILEDVLNTHPVKKNLDSLSSKE